MNRSIEAVVSMIGVLKAGGTYVPVEPDFPVDRVRFILQDSESTHIITSHKISLQHIQLDQKLYYMKTCLNSPLLSKRNVHMQRKMPPISFILLVLLEILKVY